MKTIDLISLGNVLGGAGIVSPCVALSGAKLLGASKDQIAEATAFCGLKLPSKALVRKVARRRF